MSLEALWTAEFADVGGWINGGVVVLETGRVFGGDSQYYYVGTFEVSGEKMNADVRVVHYSGERRTTFGDASAKFVVTIEGRRSGDDMIEGQMYRTDNPNLKRPIRLKRRAELP